MIRYDAALQAWGTPVQLTDTESYICGAGVAACGDQLLMTMLQQTVTITEDDVLVNSALCALLHGWVTDLSADKVEYDFSLIQPGGKLPLDVTVTNRGDHTVSAVSLAVYTAEGTLVSTQNVETSILSGMSDVLSTALDVPQNMAKTSYRVVVSVPDATDVNEADNTADFSIGYTELSMETDQLVTGAGTSLMIRVTNESQIPSGGILDLYHFEESQEPALSLIVEELQPGMSAVYMVEMDDTIISDDNPYVMIQLSADAEEYDTSDNEELLAVYLNGSVPSSSPGDVNRDGDINMNDGVMILDECAARVLDTTTLDDTQQKIADVNGDSEITLADAILILNCCAEKLVNPALSFTEFLMNEGGSNE